LFQCAAAGISHCDILVAMRGLCSHWPVKPLWICCALSLLHWRLSCGADSIVDLRPWIPRMRVKKAHGGGLEDLAREHRVVVVMTTIPARIERIEPVLDSMLAQTWQPAALYLSIPHKYNRTGESYAIPGWLRTKQGLRIVRCEDMGPGTHLLNGLRLERDPWAFLAVVDDDHIYSPDLVETLMRAALAYPGSAVAAQGFLSIPGLKLQRDSPRYLHDQGFSAGPVLVSYLGVVYQRGFFDDSVFDYSNASPQCRYQDDMWFSAHLARKGIRRVVLGAALGVQELKDMHLGPSSLTFWQENRPRQVNIECNEALVRANPGIWVWRRRLVLSVGGLPPLLFSAPPLHSGSLSVAQVIDGGSEAAVIAGAWREALRALRQLPRAPDLTYLCTAVSSGHATASSANGGQDGTSFGSGVGDGALSGSFWLDGMLVVASNACEAYTSEPKVGQLLRDPLRWEGDPNTVVVVGSLTDVVGQGAGIGPVADCAAKIYSTEDIAGSDEDEPNRQTVDRDGDGSQMANAPFCRIDGLAAVSVGALEELSVPRSRGRM